VLKEDPAPVAPPPPVAAAAVPAPAPPPPAPAPTPEPTAAPETPKPDERAAQPRQKPRQQRKQQPKGPGKIVVSTSPQMTIYVDGKKVGEGSASVEVPAGRHVVKGKDGGLNVSVVKKVNVSAGRTSNVSLKASK